MPPGPAPAAAAAAAAAATAAAAAAPGRPRGVTEELAGGVGVGDEEFEIVGETVGEALQGR